MSDAVFFFLCCTAITVLVWLAVGLIRDAWAVHCARRAARRHLRPTQQVHVGRPTTSLRVHHLEHEDELDQERRP